MLFDKITIIGIGLIGSSLARVIMKKGLAGKLCACDKNKEYLAEARELGIVDEISEDLGKAVENADLVVYATPVGAYGEITRQIVPHLKKGVILTDVGSIKKYSIREIEENLPENADVVVVPGHPVAGTEKSGPANGFDTLFEGRWYIVTPSSRSTEEAVAKVPEL